MEWLTINGSVQNSNVFKSQLKLTKYNMYGKYAYIKSELFEIVQKNNNI